MRGWLLLLAMVCGLVAAPARAQTIPLADLSCVSSGASEAAALAAEPAALDCGPDRFRATARFVRVHSDLATAAVPAGDLVWQTDPSVFDSMVLLASWSDGTQSRIAVEPALATRNWAATARFTVALPAPAAGARLLSLDMVAENPRMIATARDGHLATRSAAAGDHFGRALISTLVCGLLLAPIFYTLYFYRLMRARFMLWHCAMSFGMALFVASNAGLLFEVLPGMSLEQRWQLNSTSITLAVCAAIAFTRGMLEVGVLGRLGRGALLASAVPVVLAKVAVLLAPEAVRTTVGWYFALSFVPMMVILPWALVAAVRHGSRAARYALVGFGALALAGFVMMIDGIGVIDAGLAPEDAMLGAMVLMSLITSAGVGDRFMVLRIQLERERRRSAEMGALAFSDSLTGLANRRAFDARDVLRPREALLIADIDHFKAINDTAGHSAGDSALVHLATVLRQAVEAHPECAVYRLGGEEFGIIVPFSDVSALRDQCERVRTAVEASGLAGESDAHLTVSIGAARGEGQPIGQAFDQADRAMYRAKAAGRNCTRLACDPEPAPSDDGSGGAVLRFSRS